MQKVEGSSPFIRFKEPCGIVSSSRSATHPIVRFDDVEATSETAV